MPKHFTYILVVIVTIQIVFSFFYSSEILNQNGQLYQNQLEYQNLKIENQTLEKKFTDLTSINQLNIEQQKQSFIYINQKINLK